MESDIFGFLMKNWIVWANNQVNFTKDAMSQILLLWNFWRCVECVPLHKLTNAVQTPRRPKKLHTSYRYGNCPTFKAEYASFYSLDPTPFKISSWTKTLFSVQFCNFWLGQRIKQPYEGSMANRSNRVCEWEDFMPCLPCLPPSINLLIRGSSRLCNASNPMKD